MAKKRGRPRKGRNFELELSPKQIEAYNILHDKTTRILFYGGAGGGGKTYLGCSWIFINTQIYPKTRWGMGRKTMTLARDTMLGTFRKVLWNYSKKYKYDFESDYHFNLKDNVVINKNNGSEIRLVPLAFDPSDPDYQHFGGTEFTGFFIDEIGESPEKGFNAMMGRLGRQFNTDYGLTPPKMFVASNPTHEWIYGYFYKRWRDGTLPDYIKYIPAYYYENPFLDPAAIENMKALAGTSPNEYKRLTLGLWEYEDDPSKLMSYDAILQMWENTHVKEGKRYITADLARDGRDETVIMLWSGWRLVKVYSMKKNKLDEAYNFIRNLQQEYQVPSNRVCVDADGLGAAVKDFGKYVGFVAQKRPVVRNSVRENFRYVKDQAYYHLADKVRENKIYILPTACDRFQKEKIISDLEAIRRHKAEFDGKVSVSGKDDLRERLGRSTDYSDGMNGRAYLDLVIEHQNPYKIQGIYKV